MFFGRCIFQNNGCVRITVIPGCKTGLNNVVLPIFFIVVSKNIYVIKIITYVQCVRVVLSTGHGAALGEFLSDLKAHLSRLSYSKCSATALMCTFSTLSLPTLLLFPRACRRLPVKGWCPLYPQTYRTACFCVYGVCRCRLVLLALLMPLVLSFPTGTVFRQCCPSLHFTCFSICVLSYFTWCWGFFRVWFFHFCMSALCLVLALDVCQLWAFFVTFLLLVCLLIVRPSALGCLGFAFCH